MITVRGHAHSDSSARGLSMSRGSRAHKCGALPVSPMPLLYLVSDCLPILTGLSRHRFPYVVFPKHRLYQKCVLLIFVLSAESNSMISL